MLNITHQKTVNELPIDWQYHLDLRKNILAKCDELDWPKYLLAPEIRALCQLPTNIHHRMLLKLLFVTGARIAEALAITPSDIIEHDGYTVIKIRTLKQQNIKRPGKPKSGRIRLVPLYDYEFAIELISYTVTHCTNKKLPIFRSTHNKFSAISTETARNWLKEMEMIGKRNGVSLTVPLTPRTLRHSCAIHLILNRLPMKLVQKHLGHSNLATTECYTNLLTIDASFKYEITF
ncbi:tyrosine-type recombinase/integrase [Vibrio rotiferianus]|uniref:tyrosine-type recombinase/integrase n=1 Tax=Vibrio rotiferianus TaxID=190895 RepID=UPI0005EEEB29